MKIAFFQPYLANWRIEYLEFFIKNYDGDVVIYDGGFGGKNDTKSISGNKAGFNFRKLFSFSPVIKFKGQSYPFYFSPFLFIHLLKDKPDVIITEGEINFINNISIYLYTKLFKKKYIWWSLGKVRTRKKNVINKVLDPIVNFLLKNASCVMARNTLARTYYIEDKQLSPESVIVAPNSMNHYLALDEYDSVLECELLALKKCKVILYVGALTKQKRPLDLLESFNLLLNDFPSDVELWYVGGGAEFGALQQRVKELDLVSRVRLFGKVFKGVANYFRAADFVVVPGLGGLVINHAMIFGKPVISRLADGTELDLISNGKTGYLVDGYSNDLLVTAMKNILKNDSYIDMGIAAKALVEDRWNIDLMYNKTQECINFTPDP
jgi:glycosyltransferase involved in cell wall biosynthesis